MLLDKQAASAGRRTPAPADPGTNAYDTGAAALDNLGNTIRKDISSASSGELLAQVTETFTSVVQDPPGEPHHRRRRALGSPTIIPVHASSPSRR
jgi:hypothetical protein